MTTTNAAPKILDLPIGLDATGTGGSPTAWATSR
jgi:hypothetical protein